MGLPQVGEASLTSDFRDTQENGRQGGQEEFRVLVQVLPLMGSVTSSMTLPFQAPCPNIRAPSYTTSEFLRPLKHMVTWGGGRLELSHFINPETPTGRVEGIPVFSTTKKTVY